jgi:ATP-dependent protease ClpP protease subunit
MQAPRNQSISPIMQLRPNALAASEFDLLIYGLIGDNWFDDESVIARDVVQQLNALPASVTTINVRINSIGGNVHDALAIYNSLKAHPASIAVVVDGVAMSAAAFIAMAGDTVKMPATCLFMIHAPSTIVAGNASEFRITADQLDSYAASMAPAFVSKSGKSHADVMAILTDGQDHFYTGEQAVAEGFADALIDEEANQPETVPAAVRTAMLAEVGRFTTNVSRSMQQFAVAAISRIPWNTGELIMPNATPEPNAAAVAAIATRNEELKTRLSPLMDRPGISAIYTAALENPAATVDAVCKQVLDQMGANFEPINVGAAVDHGAARYTADFVAAAGDALAMRAGVPIRAPHAGARELANASVIDMARTCLSRAGRNQMSFSRNDVIAAALTTSDFPLLMARSVEQSVKYGFDIEPATYRLWVAQTSVPDFKEYSSIIIGAGPDLLELAEGTEFKHGAVEEDRSLPYSVKTYGRMISFTRQLLINDDLSALTTKVRGAGQAAARLEADLVYGQLGSNSGAGPNMIDSVTLFHASHDNLLSAAAALDTASLGLARTALRRQVSSAGSVLNIAPRFLLIPPELEQTAETLLAASAQRVSQGADNTLTPTWLANLTLVVESRLPAKVFYLIASPDQIDTYQLAHLDGATGPDVQSRDGFNTDTTEFRIRHDVGGRFLDWRGMVKVPLS